VYAKRSLAHGAPPRPGVYVFRDGHGQPLYVGRARELRARLRAIGLAFKPIGASWADETAKLYRQHTPVRTGATRKSIRRRNATQRRATVVGSFKVRFLSTGTRQHIEVPKSKRTLRFESGGRTIFAKKVNHPRTTGSHYLRRDALAALERHPMATELVKQWNEAVR